MCLSALRGKVFYSRNLTQYSQQQSVPDLNVLTVAFLALKKMVFLKEKKFHPQRIFFYLFSMQLFSADAMVFSKKKLKKFLTMKK